MAPSSIRDVTREVWASNLEEEMRNLRRLVDDFPYISMDCEFPAVVARPIGKFRTSTDYHYQTMRCNVDILRLIQLGITLTNAEGQVPADVCTWQFNFYFNTEEDTYAPDTIEILAKSISFDRHRTQGIMPNDFAELLTTSGLLLSDDTVWIGYHAGYDFAYLLRTLSGSPLPLNEEEFFSLLRIWFPTMYDIKCILRQCKPSLKGTLQEIAQDLGVGNTPSPTFTSGYASFLAAMAYKQIVDTVFRPTNTRWEESSFNGNLYGLGPNYVNGVVDNARSGMTSAERERPPVSLPSNPPVPVLPAHQLQHVQAHVQAQAQAHAHSHNHNAHSHAQVLGNHHAIHQQHVHAHGHHHPSHPLHQGVGTGGAAAGVGVAGGAGAGGNGPGTHPAQGPPHGYPHLMAIPGGGYVSTGFGQMGVPAQYNPNMAPLFRMDR